ncbi:MAG: hypothetical protein ABIY56_08040 [Dokdonella sp.]
MMKRLALALLMLSGTAFAQQNVDISAEEFAAGSADQKLSALGREAAASGKRLVVTAPEHWHAQIAGKIRAGGKADLVLKDGFYETVLVRVEDKPEPPKPEPVVKVAPAPKPAPAPIATPAPAPAPVAVAPPPPAPAPAPVAKPEPAAAVVEAPVVTAREPVAEGAPVASADQAQAIQAETNQIAELVASEPGDVAPERLELEKAYNDGKRVNSLLAPKELQRGDLIYTSGDAAIVVRRDRTALRRYWLEGTLDLNQSGVLKEGGNRIRIANDVVR